MVPVLDCVVQRHMKVTDTVARGSWQKHIRAWTVSMLDKTAKSLGLLAVALETEEAQASGRKNWAVKPKLHLFMGLATFLCRERGNPLFLLGLC